MGKTFSTGMLTDGIAQDSSNNIGIGGAVDATYKLKVTGAMQVTGAATFSSSVTAAAFQPTYNTSYVTVDGTLSNYSATNAVYLNGNSGGWLALSGDGSQSQRIDVTGGASGFITLRTSSTERMRITSSGNVGIGTTPSAWGSIFQVLQIGNAGSWIGARSDGQRQVWIGSNHYYTGSLWVYTGNGSASRMYQNDGGFVFQTSAAGTAGATISWVDAFSITAGSGRWYSQPTYDNTYGAGANMYINSDGNIGRATSSLKYKTDILNYDKGLDIVKHLRPVYYKSKNESEKNRIFAGLIAEEIEELGLTEFVQYSDDGTPDALAYGNMIALAFKAIQEQNEIITKQGQAIEELKALIAAK